MDVTIDRTEGLTLAKPDEHSSSNSKTIERVLSLSKEYVKRLADEDGKSLNEINLLNVGKIDPKKHLEMTVEEQMTHNIQHTLGSMLQTVVF